MATRASAVRIPTKASCACEVSLPASRCSIQLNPPPFRPDPAIYTQSQRLAAGLDVTWNNSDITWFKPPVNANGKWQIDIQPAMSISIHNLSAKAAAINTTVTVSRSALGIGMPRSPVVTQVLSLAAGETRVISVPLLVAALIIPGFIVIDFQTGQEEGTVIAGTEYGAAIFVDISHPYDSDASNNHGESVTSLALLAIEPPPMPIVLGNATAAPLNYVLSLAPNTVSARINPDHVTVAPGATGFTFLSYTLPAIRPFSSSVTILAHDQQGNYIGGFTQFLYL
jgi:hypothetical protein